MEDSSFLYFRHGDGSTQPTGEYYWIGQRGRIFATPKSRSGLSCSNACKAVGNRHLISPNPYRYWGKKKSRWNNLRKRFVSRAKNNRRRKCESPFQEGVIGVYRSGGSLI